MLCVACGGGLLPEGLRLKRRAPGQRRAKGASGQSARLERERAAVGFGDPSGNRQTEPCSRSPTGGIKLNESIEDSDLVCRRNARPAVRHAQSNRMGILRHVNRLTSSRRRVLHGILQDIQHQLTEQTFVSPKRDLGQLR